MWGYIWVRICLFCLFLWMLLHHVYSLCVSLASLGSGYWKTLSHLSLMSDWGWHFGNHGDQYASPDESYTIFTYSPIYSPSTHSYCHTKTQVYVMKPFEGYSDNKKMKINISEIQGFPSCLLQCSLNEFCHFFTHPHVAPILHDWLSFVEHKRRNQK